MKPLVEEIQNSPNQSFRLSVHEGAPACTEDDYWHIHPEYEIVYIHNGMGKRHVGNHISVYPDGELVMVGPYIPHLPLGNRQFSDNFEVVVQFGEEFIREKLGSFPELNRVMELKRRSKQGLAFGPDIRKKIRPYIKPDPDCSSPERLLWLMQLLIDLSCTHDFQLLNVHSIEQEKSRIDYDRIKLIYNYITHHFDEEVSLETLAGKVGLTKNSLCRFFKKVTGKTVVDYLTEYRINMAKELLLQGSLSVSEVLFRSGFNDPAFFYKKFRFYTGCTPRSFQLHFTNLSHHQRSGHTHPLL